MARLNEPMIVTAFLQQGVVYDVRHGIALDGLLVSALRANAAQGAPGSLLDGGLALDEPQAWDVPLEACEASQGLWHWLATSGLPTDLEGNPVPLIPDPHRLLQTLDERRASQIAIRQPQNVGGSRGRFRQRVTPVLSIPAAKIVWHAVGDPSQVESLLTVLGSIGGRRGSGEGAVTKWSVELATPQDINHFGHTHPNGKQGRPLPEDCIRSLGKVSREFAPAGLRPPLFHHSNQKLLVVNSEEEK
jgi:hypothetical protein